MAHLLSDSMDGLGHYHGAANAKNGIRQGLSNGAYYRAIKTKPATIREDKQSGREPTWL